MTQFPGARQPALGIQDAAMLPAQTAGNLFIQRLAAAEAAFVPTTQTFDSTTSSTVLNSTSASTGGGSLRNLMIPVDTANFQAITQPQFTQFGNQQLIAAILASQTGAGSIAGRAILGASGIDFHGSGCGCTCTREMSEETVIDEGNTNGIIDEDDMVMAASAKAAATVPAAPAAAAAVPVVSVSAQAAAPANEAPAAQTAPTASIQYVTYNA